MTSRCVYLLLALACLCTVSSANPRITYQYPVRNAVEVSTQTGIGLRASSVFIPGSVLLTVRGAKSGVHVTKLSFAVGGRMVIAKPLVPFVNDEDVTVSLKSRFGTSDSLTYTFLFHTLRVPTAELWTAIRDLYFGNSSNTSPEPAAEDIQDSLPKLTVVANERPTPGSIVMVNFGWTPVDNGNFLWVLDEHGNVRKLKNLGDAHAIDFQRQPTGIYTYFDYHTEKFYALDSNLEIFDSFWCEHGYMTDGHEFRMDTDGGYSLFGVVTTTDNLSHVVDGGSMNALIITDVMQKLDKDRNVIFEWRGIDHYGIHDALHEDLTASTIDLQHANSIDFDADGNFLVSNRDLDEIDLISAETGEFIWRFGGRHNQFTLVGDTDGISYQHCARFLPNGNILVFDNGCYHKAPYARAVEFEIDSLAHTARLVWQFHHTPEIPSVAMGYVTRLPNGNTFISWGHDSTAMTEVTPDGRTVFEMRMGGLNYTYRAIKYPEAPASVSRPSAVHAVQLTATHTGIEIELESPEIVRVTVSDILGREEWRSEQRMLAGRTSLDLDFLARGPHFVSVRTPDAVGEMKLIR